MSLPILVTPAAKPLQPKPSAPASPSDKPSFSQALGNAERRADPSKPTAAESEVVSTEEARAEKPTEQEPQAPQAEQAPAETGLPLDLQIMLAVSSQVAMPVVPANAQPQSPLAAGGTASLPSPAVALAAAPVQVALAPAAPVVQQVLADQAKVPDAAAKVSEAGLPQPEGATSTLESRTAIAPSLQPETGEDQETPEDSNAPAQKGPKPPVMPVASQHVPQSLESLRAGEKVESLRESALVTQAPEKAKPVLEAAAVVTGLDSESAAPAPVLEPVRPWQLPHAVGTGEPQAPQAQLIEEGAPAGEPMPMREAMRMPFTQAAREPGKPSELRLQLSPEHLGRMEIRVMSHEGNLSAQIRVDHTQAREMMQVQLAELRQTLADQGIKIDRLEVSVGQDQRRGEPSFTFGGNLQQQADQQQQQQAHRTASGRVSYYGDEAFDEGGEEAERLPLAGIGATAVDYQA